MIDRTCEVWEWNETGEIFLILGYAYTDNIGDRKWESLIIHESMTHEDQRVDETCTFSEMWFSDSQYSWKMKRLSDAP